MHELRNMTQYTSLSDLRWVQEAHFFEPRLSQKSIYSCRTSCLLTGSPYIDVEFPVLLDLLSPKILGEPIYNVALARVSLLN